MARASNQAICEAFRRRLTSGFFIPVGSDISRDQALALTKEWRNQLWKEFREIEDRMCPKPPSRHQVQAEEN